MNGLAYLYTLKSHMHSIYMYCLARCWSGAQGADLAPEAALSGCTGMLKPVVRALKGCRLVSCGGSSMLTAADAAGADAGAFVGQLVHLTVFSGCNIQLVVSLTKNPF